MSIRPVGEAPHTTQDCSGDKRLTKQSFKDECDINNIMKKYRKTGQLDPASMNQRQEIFADVSEFGDFQEMQNKIQKAEEAFSTLSSELRARFQNDPAQLLEFVSDRSNLDEARELGIIQKEEPEPDTQKSEPVVPPKTTVEPPTGT